MNADQWMYQRSRCERAAYRLYDLRGKQGRAGKSPFPLRVLKGGWIIAPSLGDTFGIVWPNLSWPHGNRSVMNLEASFCEAIRIAREQKSVSLQKRAEAAYAEYRRQKASGSGGRAIRLPLW
jgi:hypothetical protein